MLLVITVIIGALATSKAGAVITTQSRRIVCQIAGGRCETKPTVSHAPLAHAAASGPQGPALGGHGPVTVLPWPGTSVAISCTYDERSPNVCKGADANGV